MPHPWVETHHQRYHRRRWFVREILLQKLAFNLVVQPRLHHPERIPQAGGAIILINHVTAVDPIIVAGVVRPRYVMIMSKIENFQHPLTALIAKAWGVFPVRRGEVDREALKITSDLLEAGELVLIAPEGTRSPSLITPREGAAYLAAKTNTLIVPTAVYNADNWLKGFFQPRRIPVDVAFGRPFRLAVGGQKRLPRQLLPEIMDQMMYQLAILLPERYRGVYHDLSQMRTNHLEFI